MSYQGVYYSEYLQLDKILKAQEPESCKDGQKPAHDEMLFIVIHQAYELWFKQIMHEVGSVIDILSKPGIQDNSPDLYVINHRMDRVITIFQVLIQQIDIMETMTPLDFLDFRDLLRPASGFQSIQFKLLESYLGLRMENRHGKEYYISQLKPEDAAIIRDAEKQTPLIDLVNNWLERMPFFEQSEFWNDAESSNPMVHPFWKDYKKAYESGLSPAETSNVERFEKSILGNEKIEGGSLSAKAKQAALFIMLYRDYPLLQLPFQFINTLLEIDESMATWRYRHMNMVHRMIGMRTGTGGSTGKDYLKGALEKHYIFSEFAELTSYLVNKQKLPTLSQNLKNRLGFSQL